MPTTANRRIESLRSTVTEFSIVRIARGARGIFFRGVQPVVHNSKFQLTYYNACILKKRTDAPPTPLQKTIWHHLCSVVML